MHKYRQIARENDNEFICIASTILIYCTENAIELALAYKGKCTICLLVVNIAVDMDLVLYWNICVLYGVYVCVFVRVDRRRSD